MKNQKKNRGTKITLIVLIIVVAISNTPPLQYFLLENYHYTNADGSFQYTEEPGKALTFKVAERRWERFKAENPNSSNVLYRTFRIKPWQFWEWWQFVAHSKRYTLPYNDKFRAN